MAVALHYPSEELREALAQIGIEPTLQERRILRTLLYSLGMTMHDGASADQIARMVLEASKGADPQIIADALKRTRE